MTLYVEAVMRGMPETPSEKEQAMWWYQRDLDHAAAIARLRDEIRRLRSMLEARDELEH